MGKDKMWVASTLATDVAYTRFVRHEGNDMPEPEKRIVIKGGFAVAHPKTLVTPSGAILTEVSAEDVAFLMENKTFQKHQENGFVKVLTTNPNGEAVAADMATDDPSAPLTPNHFEMGGNGGALPSEVRDPNKKPTAAKKK